MMGFWRRKPITNDRPQTLGMWGESWAQSEYEKRGYRILACNEYNRRGKQLGEIDFIARTKLTLAFVEVKTRTIGIHIHGTAAESVNRFKQIKILKAAKLYLQKHPELVGLRPHIDVCLIGVPRSERLDTLDKSAISVTILENSVEDWN